MSASSPFAPLADLFRHQARTRPDGLALVHDGRETRYALLDERASRIANGLIAAGCRPQSRIGFLGKNSDRYFELLAGATKANGVLVGVNWRLAPPEIEYVLDDAEVEILFVGAEYCEVIERLRGRLTRLRRIIAMDGGHGEWESFDSWRDAQPAEDPMLPAGPDDDVIQLYTSGTTGHPKGVQLTNRNYAALLEQSAATGLLTWEPGAATLVCMPSFHVSGVNMGILAFAQGCTAVVLREVDPQEILPAIPAWRVRYTLFVPAVMLLLLQNPKARETDFSSLEVILYGASPIAEDLMLEARRMFGCDLIQLYGMTETTGFGTYLPPEDHEPARGRLRSCGRPAAGVEVRVVDSAGRDLPPGEVGEILMRSGTVMKGYWNNPEATAATVVAGWLHTGDAGYLDAEGYVYIHDRVKDMIVSGGENVYPAEVENALFAHPEVADVAVIGVPDPKWGEAVKACVVLKPGARVGAAELIAFARARIAGYKVPKTIDFVAALPRNPSGKILRRELRRPYWEGQSRQVG